MYIFILIFISFQIFTKDLVINNVSIYQGKEKGFIGPVALKIKNNKIDSITSENSKKIDFYVLPSFCDIFATPTVNSLGGINSIQDIDNVYKSYLNHGFSHVHTINNPSWFNHDFRKKLDKNLTIIPSGKSIIFKTQEYPTLPEEIYHLVDDESQLILELNKQFESNLKVITLLNRYYINNEKYFTLDILRNISKINKKNSNIIISNFADTTAILDTIRSGHYFIKDPIPIELDKILKIEIIEKIKYIPGLNSYYNLTIKTNKNLLYDELDMLSKEYKFFKKYYYNNAKDNLTFYNSTEIDADKVLLQYKGYIEYLKKNKIIYKNLFVSGESGNFFSFPAFSALKEFQILSEITEDPFLILDSITKKNCTLINSEYTGEIIENGIANLILFKEYPINNYSLSKNIVKIFINGKQIELENYSKK